MRKRGSGTIVLRSDGRARLGLSPLPRRAAAVLFWAVVGFALTIVGANVLALGMDR